jgi:outer membrane protein OmpA-like peptidoglycan-associated protein
MFAQENLIMNSTLETKLNKTGKSYIYDSGHVEEFIHNDTFSLYGLEKKDFIQIIVKDWDYVNIPTNGLRNNGWFSDAGRANSGNVFKVIFIENIDESHGNCLGNINNVAVGELCKPLIKGNEYLVSFYLKPFSGNHFTKNICAVFYTDSSSRKIIFGNNTQSFNEYLKTPDWCMSEVLKDTSRYTKYEFVYTATGDEKYFHIGNIRCINDTYSDKKTFKNSFQKTKQYGYWRNHENKFMCRYALDDISVFPISNKNEICIADELLTENIAREKSDTILLATLLFDYNKSVNSEKLDALINTVYYAENIEKLIVSGHTDKEGTEEYNKQLSLKRAAFVSEKLMLFTSLPIEIIGYGFTQPFSDTDNRLNRRVEVFVIFK